jgi:hypothetical protein
VSKDLLLKEKQNLKVFTAAQIFSWYEQQNSDQGLHRRWKRLTTALVRCAVSKDLLLKEKQNLKVLTAALKSSLGTSSRTLTKGSTVGGKISQPEGLTGTQAGVSCEQTFVRLDTHRGGC